MRSFVPLQSGHQLTKAQETGWPGRYTKDGSQYREKCVKAIRHGSSIAFLGAGIACAVVADVNSKHVVSPKVLLAKSCSSVDTPDLHAMCCIVFQTTHCVARRDHSCFWSTSSHRAQLEWFSKDLDGRICRSEAPARFQRALDEDLFLAYAMGAGAIVLLVSASRTAKKGR